MNQDVQVYLFTKNLDPGVIGRVTAIQPKTMLSICNNMTNVVVREAMEAGGLQVNGKTIAHLRCDPPLFQVIPDEFTVVSLGSSEATVRSHIANDIEALRELLVTAARKRGWKRVKVVQLIRRDLRIKEENNATNGLPHVYGNITLSMTVHETEEADVTHMTDKIPLSLPTRNRFNYHVPDQQGKDAMSAIRKKAMEMASIIEAHCPANHEQQLALDHLFFAMMSANSSVVQSYPIDERQS